MKLSTEAQCNIRNEITSLESYLVFVRQMVSDDDRLNRQAWNSIRLQCNRQSKALGEELKYWIEKSV